VAQKIMSTEQNAVFSTTDKVFLPKFQDLQGRILQQYSKISLLQKLVFTIFDFSVKI